ncbi:Protein trichome birefringence-like 37, partial [Cucurbita argyrosperma subsp. argyrosperma]
MGFGVVGVILNLLLVLQASGFVCQCSKQNAAGFNTLKGKKASEMGVIFSGKMGSRPVFPLFTIPTCPFHRREPDTLFTSNTRGDRDSCTLPKILTEWMSEEMQWEEDNVVGLTEPEYVGIAFRRRPNAKSPSSGETPSSSVFFSGLWSNTAPISDAISCGHSERGRRASTETRLHRGRCKAWLGMDVLVFSTPGIGGPIQETLSGEDQIQIKKKRVWDLIQDGTTLSQDMDRLVAFYKGLTTWARWVDLNVDPYKNKGGRNGMSPKRTVMERVKPLTGSMYPGGAPPAVDVVNRVLSRIKVPVYLLDITTLSQLRKRRSSLLVYSGEISGTDCSHCAFLDLPDTWNQLMYAALLTM